MKAIKKSIITRKVRDFEINTELVEHYVPQAGDVAVFRVLELGKHTRIQATDGKLRHIFPGDLIMAVFGARYATAQFEGYVPETICDTYQILGQGGAVGILKSFHARWEERGPTELKLVGYATDEESNVINTRFLAVDPVEFQPDKSNGFDVILSVGSSMDSGKTTTAGFLARGLSLAQKRVAYIKLTGTVYSKDKDFVFDCGAERVLDFSDFGFPSTYMCDLPDLLQLYATALDRASRIRPDYVIIEIADGLYQRETNMLLSHPMFAKSVDHLILSCADSLGVRTGIDLLGPVLSSRLIGVSGRFTASPLLVEEVQNNIALPVLTLEDLQNPLILEQCLRRQLHVAV